MNRNTYTSNGNAFFNEFEEILGGNVILKFIRGIGHLLGEMLTAGIFKNKKHRQKGAAGSCGERK